ncbi:S8 family serine peptidase [Nocardioides rubriscoriae]|uniref:S8 family serine peptidase n=1 Tax=Nocardioides rubriscoriae TaxID=642762 RepID=UPI0011E05286|nr:S8 family serine peptidase [Nocardioides rubriscoriae]
MTRSAPRRLALPVALSVVGLAVAAAPGPTAAADAAPTGADCTSIDDTDIERVPATASSAPLEALLVERAQQVVQRRTGRAPGAGVRVAVLDSGVLNPLLPVVGGSRPGPPVFHQGTAVAGVIAGPAQDGGVGPVGVAPGAEIYDVRVYDSDDEQDGATPTAAGLAAGLDSILPLVGSGRDDLRIVTVPLALDRDSQALEAAVRRVTDAGAIVVAATGDRGDVTYDYGEDVTRYPAGYATTNPLVVAVGTTTDPVAEKPELPAGLLTSAVDVVVPTYGAVSYAINASTCSFYTSSTAVAAAEVSGVMALLAAAYPGDTPQQLVARLEVTATGAGPSSSGAVDKFRGRGVVQPVEALTRPVQPDRDGTIRPGRPPAPRAEPAPLPQDEPDLLRGTRHDAVWWGLFGGGVLVVAMLLRPVLSRRRSQEGAPRA